MDQLPIGRAILQESSAAFWKLRLGDIYYSFWNYHKPRSFIGLGRLIENIFGSGALPFMSFVEKALFAV